MTRHSYVLVTVALVVTASAGCGTGRGSGRSGKAGGHTAVTASASSRSPVSSADRSWLAEAHQADLAEVQCGRLAEERGASAAVRRAGGVLVADHTAFDTEVRRVAETLDVELPRTAAAEDVTLARRLAAESGGRFDRDFVSAMIAGHEKVIADTQREVREGSSPKVTALARAALPTLHKHLAILRKAAPTS